MLPGLKAATEMTTTNFTVALPNGTTNHGNPNLICVPATWHVTLLFFATNYVAHAATALSMPGETPSEAVLVLLTCLIIPASALNRSYRAIVLHAGLSNDPLVRATRSNALCMVKNMKVAGDGGSNSQGVKGHSMDENNVSSEENLAPKHGSVTAQSKPSDDIENQMAAVDTRPSVKLTEGAERLPRTGEPTDQDLGKVHTVLVILLLLNDSF